jgi:hypothetical protein
MIYVTQKKKKKKYSKQYYTLIIMANPEQHRPRIFPEERQNYRGGNPLELPPHSYQCCKFYSAICNNQHREKYSRFGD